MLDLISYSLWAAVFFIAYVHCPFFRRAGKAAWTVATALAAIVQMTIRHHLCTLRCTYYKLTHKPVECAADPKNKPAPNVIMRRPAPANGVDSLSSLRQRLETAQPHSTTAEIETHQEVKEE